MLKTDLHRKQYDSIVRIFCTTGKPQAPHDLQLLSSLPTSLFVGWRPSFDGGEEQNFQLEYRKVNPTKGVPDLTELLAIYVDGRNASYLTLYQVNIFYILEGSFIKT